MSNELKKHDLRDSIKAIALDIGKEVAHHIEIMYPEAVKACSSTFLISVRGATYNRIMAALDPDNKQDVASTLKQHDKMRRKNRAVYKRIRRGKLAQ